jgi:alpha-1,3-mannosyltransferase
VRITHVVRQFPPSVGGLEEAVLQLCSTLQRRGAEVDVVTLDRIAQDSARPLPALDDVAGLRVRRIPFRGSWRYPVAPGVLAHIRNADVVHVHGIDFFFDFLAATVPLHRKPLVASTHGGFFHTTFAHRLKQLYFQTATRASARAYRAILASSEADLALFGPVVPADRLRLAVNGVDVGKWSDLASPSLQRHLLFIGRFSSNKTLPALLPWLRALRRLHPTWRLTVAGQPGDVTADDLRGLAERLDVADALTVIEKPSDDAIATAIRSASYVVSPSRHEGFGISIVEGMAAGLVPVLSRIPPFLRFVGEARTGLTIDFEDPEAAIAVEHLHASLAARPDRARACVMAAARPYAWDGATDVVQRCYGEIVRPRAASPVNASARISP